MNAIKIIVTSVVVMSAMLANAKGTNNINTSEAPAINTSEAPAIITSEAKNTVVNYKTSLIKDEQGRIINKIIFKDVEGLWCPLGAYSVNYGEDENVLTYALWDCENHRFTLNAQQQRFNSKDYPVLISDSVLK